MTAARGSRGRRLLQILLAALGLAVSSAPGHGAGEARLANPGYIDDAQCARCHAELASSYQEVAMSNALYRPHPDRAIEDFDVVFVHEPSRRHYVMSLEAGRYVMRRYQLTADGDRIHETRQEVDWILGSGNHSRTYLFQVPSGELYQLPLAWYSQSRRWAMAPGFDRPDHLGLERRVRRECMFCHSALPQATAGSDAFGELPAFPQDLPDGLGCQRCHGPGALHAANAASGGSIETVMTSIVNPGRLDRQRRNDLCYSCHMQPSVALFGVRRFGRGDYSFRPGELLSDYLVPMDVEELGQERGDRFEINHHPYRLEQSACFERSAGELTCLTCHDPHIKVPVAARAAHYRAKCLGCHDLEATVHSGEEPGDCIACHMPERRTQDVVHVTMTDHRIQRRPEGDYLAPLAERDPILVEAEALWPERAPTGQLFDLYRAVTVLRAGGGRGDDALAALGNLLARNGSPHFEPWLDLGQGELLRGRHDAARVALGEALERAPDHPQALAWLGLASAREGRIDEALEWTGRALEVDPRRAEGHFNRGLLLATEGRDEEAEAAFDRALALRPNLASAWFGLGQVRARTQRNAQAVEAFERALSLDPSHERAYVGLATALVALDRLPEAIRYLRHGRVVARRPAIVSALLEELNAERPSGS